LNQGLAHIKRYWKFWKDSSNRHGVHSPFVFDLIEKVLRNTSSPELGPKIEARRKVLISDVNSLHGLDPGAGSSIEIKERRVKDIARISLSSPDQCRVLHHLVKYFKPKNYLEFGSCMGISAAYVASAGLERLISMEGNEGLFELSRETISQLGLDVDLRKGLFKDLLEPALKDLGQIDMAFIDGHHSADPTLKYFEHMKPYLHKGSVLIFDDIHWSEGMESAWAEIQKASEVTLTVDLYWCGLVFFQKGLSGQHFKVRY